MNQTPFTPQEQPIAQKSPALPPSPPLVSPIANVISEANIPTSPESTIAPAPEKGGEGGDNGVSHIARARADASGTSAPPASPPLPPLPPLPLPTAASQVTNAEFIAAIFPQLAEGTHAAVCSKPGDPTTGGWVAKRADQVVSKLSDTNNNYLNCSSFNLADDSLLHARKDNFAAYHLLMLDDIGTKIPFDRFGNFEWSYLLETSPGNYQGGIILAEPITNGVDANQMLDAAIAAGLCDEGATGAQGRWMRLPVGINGKGKHANEAGEPFQCRLAEWNPERVYTEQEIIDGLKFELAPVAKPKSKAVSNTISSRGYEHDG